MENKKPVIQIMILDDEKHQNYLKDYDEAPLDFEEFINFELEISLMKNEKSNKLFRMKMPPSLSLFIR